MWEQDMGWGFGCGLLCGYKIYLKLFLANRGQTD
jgi:hypothetical protein